MSQYQDYTSFSQAKIRGTLPVSEKHPELYCAIQRLVPLVKGDVKMYPASVVVLSKTLAVTLREEKDTPILVVDRKTGSFEWKSTVFKGRVVVLRQLALLETLVRPNLSIRARPASAVPVQPSQSA